MRTFLRNLLSLQKFDWVILVLVLILMSVGLAAIYSVDLSQEGKLNFFTTQVIALGIGLILFFSASLMHGSFFRSAAKFSYIASVIFLVAVLIFGESIRGTRGWFQFFGFSFQPVEFAKIGLILFSARWIERQGRRFDRWQFILTSGFFTFVLAILVLIQPDLGSTVVLCSIWFGFLLLTGVKKRYTVALVLVLAAVAIMSWHFVLQDYQKQRFLTFINQETDPLGAGYNVKQSLIAIGSGQFFGRGLGFGSQSQLHFLPEAQTDFIFSVIAEELGFLGATVVLITYFFLLWRLLIIAKKASDDFTAYTVLGIALLFFCQLIINVGGATGLLPVTGVTLPFVSYGGSSLLINLVLLGIAESMAKSTQV